MSSGLTTRGRCLLAAGVAAGACSLILDERDLLRVAVFVVTLPLLAALVASRGRVGLQAHRALVPDRLPVHTQGEVFLTVRAQSRVPLGGLLLEDGVPHALGARPRFVLDRARGRTGMTLRYPVRAELRGVHHLGPLRVRVRDPFGLAEFERILAERSTLVVVPEVHQLAGMPGGSGLDAGEDGATRLRPGHGADDAMVREYRHGDDMRRVHWKSTAHRDELMVRVDERPWRSGFTVLLDRRSATHRGLGASASLEWAISFAASTCLHLRSRGRSVRLRTTDGIVLSEESPASSENGDVLESLAALAPSPQRDLARGEDLGAGQSLIAILGATTPTAVAELTRQRPFGAHNRAVLLDVRGWDGVSQEAAPDQQEAARLLRGAGWEVVVVHGPGEAMDLVWRQLCRAEPLHESPVEVPR